MGIDCFNSDKTFIIAELSANHNQNFDLAVKTIEAMAASGADAVKVQTYKPSSLVMDIDNSHFGMIKTGLWKGVTRYQLYEGACMPYEWHKPLKDVAERLGLIFFSTPFDLEGVDILEDVDIPIYKIASFEINDIPLIKKVASKNKPIIMSTGVADYHDIQIALDACHEMGNDNVSLLKCTSEYPASYEQANLITIPDMIKVFGKKVGVSDHTMGYVVPMTAVALGAHIIEKHFILDRSLGGADSAFSMEPAEFRLMVENVRNVEKCFGYVKKEITDHDRAKRRAVYATVDIHPGDVFSWENTRSFRPADGLSPVYYEKMLGQVAKRFIPKGEPLQIEDININ
jgi:pseudaminic acid synthase